MARGGMANGEMGSSDGRPPVSLDGFTSANPEPPCATRRYREEQHGQEQQHRVERNRVTVYSLFLQENHGPWEQEYRFHIEYQEQDGEDVEADVMLDHAKGVGGIPHSYVVSLTAERRRADSNCEPANIAPMAANAMAMAITTASQLPA